MNTVDRVDQYLRNNSARKDEIGRREADEMTKQRRQQFGKMRIGQQEWRRKQAKERVEGDRKVDRVIVVEENVNKLLEAAGKLEWEKEIEILKECLEEGKKKYDDIGKGNVIKQTINMIQSKSYTSSSRSQRKYFSRTPDNKIRHSKTKHQNHPISLQFKQRSQKQKPKKGILQNYLKHRQQSIENKIFTFTFTGTDKSVRHYFKKNSKSKSHVKDSTITGSLSFRENPNKRNRNRTNTGQNIQVTISNPPITKSMTSAKQISLKQSTNGFRPRKLSDASDTLHMRMIKESIIKQKGALSYDTSLISKLKNPLFNRVDDLKHSQIITQDSNDQSPKKLLEMPNKQMTQSIHYGQQPTPTALDRFAKFRIQSRFYQPSKHIKTEPINQNPEQ